MARASMVACTLAFLGAQVAADSRLNANGHGTGLSNSMPGIGIDPSTGTVTTSVLIEVPPGRNEIAPSLALRYNSGNNSNGVAGHGWSLSLGVIERLANKGVPNYDATDAFFVLDGTRNELVHIGGEVYRSEIETSFSRIQFVGGTHWVVTDTKGTRSYFGQIPESRVADPTAPTRVFRYLLDRVEDVHGNYMTVSYTQFPGEDKYPLEVQYTGFASSGGGAGSAPYAKVVFAYEGQERPDSSFSYLAGFRIDRTKRLDRIDVMLMSGELQRRYDLIYTVDPDVNKSYLTKVRQLGSDGTTAQPDIKFEYSGVDVDYHPAISIPLGNAPAEAFRSGRVRMLDLNGDARDDLVYGPPGGAPWQWFESDGTGSFLAPVLVLNSPPYPIESAFASGRRLRFEDFTGDGLLDVVHQTPGFMATLWINNGQGGFDPPISANLIVDRDAKYIDMNRDGLVDLVYGPSFPTPYQWFIAFNHGNGIFDATFADVIHSPTGPAGGLSGSYYFEYGDYDGDGLIDVARESTLWMNNGQNGFHPPVIDPNLPSTFVASSVFGLLYKPDLNGDGLTDFMETIDHCYPSPPCFPVFSSRGAGTFSDPYHVGNLYSHGFLFFDVNGDGYQDVLTSVHDSFTDLWQFNINDNGVGFLPPVPITQHHPWLHFVGNSSFFEVDLVLADVNGDNRTDIVYGGDPDFGGPEPVQYQVWLGRTDPRSSRGGVMVAIDNSVGLRTEFTYRAESVKGRGSPVYGNAHQSFKMEAVATRVDLVAVSGEQYTTTYTYEGGLWDEADREFRGFAKVTETDHEGNQVVTRIHQDDVFRFKPFEVASYGPTGHLYTKRVNAWLSEALDPGVEFVYLAEVNEYTYDGNETGRRTREQFLYGESPQYGNLTGYIEWGEVDLATGTDIGTDKRTTETEYGNNISGSTYLIGFPRHVVRRDISGNTMREAWMYYDGATSHATPPTVGLRTKDERWSDGGTNPQIISTYDAYGNKLSSLDAEHNLTTIIYDTDWALFPVMVVNELTHSLHSTYYGIEGEPLSSGGYAGLFGQVKSATDPNGEVGYFTYDALGRPTKIIDPLDTLAFPTSEITYTPVYTPGAEHWRRTIRRRVEHGEPATLDSYEFQDGMGRLIQSKSPMETTGTYSISGQTVYDSRSRHLRVFAPFASNAPAPAIEGVVLTRPHTSHLYDAIGRVTQRTNADGSYSTTVHDDWVVTMIDENGHQTKTHLDAYGRTALIEEYHGADGRASPTYPASSFTLYATTTFGHNSEDEIEVIADDHDNFTTLLYDKLGRRTHATEPNAGAIAYAHDLNDNLLWRLDAKGQRISMSYDALNRVDTKSYPESTTPTVDYVYDAGGVPFSKGRMTNVDVSITQGVDFAYDELGRQTFLRQTIDNQSYEIHRTFDALGRLKTLTYPDSHEVQYFYNAAGAVETVVDSAGVTHVADIDYDARGKITDIHFGNGVHTAYTYDADTFRLTRTLTQKDAQVLQDLSYLYDPGGNVTTIANGITGQAETFAYDELNRLTQATGPYCGGACTKIYAYDEVGNILQKDGLTYTYGENGAGPNAVTSLSDGSSMEYDANGNMLRQTRPGVDYDYSYDRENRLSTVWRDGALRARYDYDDRGHRVKTTVYRLNPIGPMSAAAAGSTSPINLKVTTHFVETLFEKRVENGVSARHVYLGPLRVVSISSDGKTRYVHTDHLSGTNVTTDETGAERERIAYAPFGEVVLHTTTGAGSEEAYFQFTGQRFDEESELLFMQARYYDPKLGRFLTPDSIVPDLANPQALNRYAYAYNNPVRLTDPTGHSPQEGGHWWETAWGAIKSAGQYVGQVAVGAGNEAWGVVEGVASIAAHPIDFAKGVGHAIASPIETAKAIGTSVAESFEAVVSGNPEAIGAGVVQVGSLFIGGVGAAKGVSAVGRLARGADKAADFARVGAARGAAQAAQAAQQGFKSFSALKRALGPAGPGKHWHHIVEQTPGNVGRFGAETIHNTGNVMRLEAGVHRQISGYFSSMMPGANMTVRRWLSTQSFEAQREFGMQVLRNFGALP